MCHTMELYYPAGEYFEKHPDIYLETSGYWDMFEVPLDDTMPDENVKMRLAYMDEDVAHDINYPSNTHKRETMKKRGEICKKSGSLELHNTVLGNYDEF